MFYNVINQDFLPYNLLHTRVICGLDILSFFLSKRILIENLHNTTVKAETCFLFILKLAARRGFVRVVYLMKGMRHNLTFRNKIQKLDHTQIFYCNALQCTIFQFFHMERKQIAPMICRLSSTLHTTARAKNAAIQGLFYTLLKIVLGIY